MSSSFDFPDLAAAAAVADSPAAGEAARLEAEAARESELAAARAAGLAEGLEAARAELRPAAEALAAAARELAAERERVAEALERAAAELALQIAEKVLAAALEVRPELVVEVVRGALRRLAEQQDAAVLVNPEDLGLLRDALDGLMAELGARLTLRAERRVPRGGCMLRTQAGEVDARIAEQLDRAREIVAGELGG